MSRPLAVDETQAGEFPVHVVEMLSLEPTTLLAQQFAAAAANLGRAVAAYSEPRSSSSETHLAPRAVGARFLEPVPLLLVPGYALAHLIEAAAYALVPKHHRILQDFLAGGC